MPATPITFFNRHTRQLETEAVYGEAFLRWAYEHPLGQVALHALVKHPLFSRWYGWRMDRPASRDKIQPFIDAYGLDCGLFADPVESFRHFNDFFYRRLKPGARPIDAAPEALVFPADGRHLLIQDVAACDHFFVTCLVSCAFFKGYYSLIHFLYSDNLASKWPRKYHPH
jgi:phosphatidylserine decarboxylase